MRKTIFFLGFLVAVAQASASEGLSLRSGQRDSVFTDPLLGKFLPVHQAFQASTWLSAGRLYVGFENAPGYYLHRHQFALGSRGPTVSFGELDIPPGEFVAHPHLGDMYVFYDQVVLSAPIEPASADTGPLAITVTFQGCSDDGLCYPPAQVELEAFAGSPPASFSARQSPVGAVPQQGDQQSE